MNEVIYCKKCGKTNPEKSKFCQHCGIEFNDALILSADKEQHEYTENYVSVNDLPYPYSISTWKLVLMSLATFGLYDIYWFYKHWKSFNAHNKLNHTYFSLLASAYFAPITSYSLFKHISNNIKNINNGHGLESGGLAILYFFLRGFLLGFLPLIFVQQKINLFWKKKYGSKLVRSKLGVWNWIVILTVPVIFIYGLISEDDTNNMILPPSTVVTSQNDFQLEKVYDQEEIASSVVNILCPSTIEGEKGSGGSGTILSDDGMILTNSHIIPQDDEYLNVSEDGCLVILPNPSTGQPEDVYWATPIVVPGISDTYDLAFLSIYAAYFDEDEESYQGIFPRKFPAFDDTTRCTNENVKLGESVRIFGYPAISGGYSLTITEGLVSSFPGEGLIVTSAKISHGNSGGLAVDKSGCMIGVPSLVNSDESESLGVIYSMDLINQFSEEISEYQARL
ncbi:MAG: trypsin-like peptidase domain-containing protein [bacterium]|nr:trypsin-like peptidase domain-containing protein [bacterium]